MTAVAASGGWLLLGLAVCVRCGSDFTPVIAGRSRRFYSCGCNSLRDVEPLHASIVAAAADHNRRCTPNALRPYIVLRKWATATPDQLTRFLPQQLAHIAVDADGSALCYWHHGHDRPTVCQPYTARPGHHPGHDHQSKDRKRAIDQPRPPAGERQ